MFIYQLKWYHIFVIPEKLVYLHIETKIRNKDNTKHLKTHDYEKKCIARDYEQRLANVQGHR